MDTIKLITAPKTAKIPDIKKSSAPRDGTVEAKEPPKMAKVVGR